MKKAKKHIALTLIFVLLLSTVCSCGEDFKKKETEFLDTFYEDKYNSLRNEIVKSLWGCALNSMLQVTGFSSGQLVDDYEKKIEQYVDPEIVDTNASKVQQYAKTQGIDFTNDEAKKMVKSLIVHIVENYEYYYN